MTTYTRVGAVTGANKGIGLAIVRQLALQYPRSGYNDGPLLVYLTARSDERGKAAVEALQADAQLEQAKALRSQGGLTDIKYHRLDIDSTQSIHEFAEFLDEEHPQGIDFLINNAGIAMQGFDINVVQKTIHCNYFGTLEATQQLLPHIKAGGRLVNVASMTGHLSSQYSPAIRSRFHNATTPQEVTQLMEEFTAAVADGSHRKDWPSSAYAVSKAGVIGMTKTIAEQNAQSESGSGRQILINSCCPGYVKTDMTRGGGAKTPDEGAQTPVILALRDLKGSNGAFWQNGRKINW